MNSKIAPLAVAASTLALVAAVVGATAYSQAQDEQTRPQVQLVQPAAGTPTTSATTPSATATTVEPAPAPATASAEPEPATTSAPVAPRKATVSKQQIQTEPQAPATTPPAVDDPIRQTAPPPIVPADPDIVIPAPATPEPAPEAS